MFSLAKGRLRDTRGVTSLAINTSGRKQLFMLRDNAGIRTTAYKLAVSTFRMNAESRFSSTGAKSPQSSLYRGAIAAHMRTVASEFKKKSLTGDWTVTQKIHLSSVPHYNSF